MESSLLPILVFAAVYLTISLEFLNKAVAALLGVMLLLILGVADAHTAAKFIDFETIMLLLGMMAIVAVLRKSGFFSILSVRIAKMTQGSPLRILILFSIVTATVSAFLDNVTTVLIIVPIVIELTRGMELNPRLYVIAMAMVSNIGGTATLIGDPPNIIIGSKAGLNFNQFILNLSLPVAVSFCGLIFFIWLANRQEFRPIDTNLAKLFSVQFLLEKIEFDFLNVKLEKAFLIKSVVCLGVAILLFMTQTITRITPGVVAITMAMILFTVTKIDVEHILLEIEWSTLLFFAGLFILVGVLEERGVMEWIVRNIFLRIGHNPYVMVLMVLWVSGVVSGFMDNIPFTITMIPIVRLMMESHPVPHNILWWALSLGACFGGNFTLIGASANIVSAGVAKRLGYEITFFEFLKTSALGTVLTLMISSLVLIVYLWVSL